MYIKYMEEIVKTQNTNETTRVRANRCHGHFPNILLENMLYRYIELVLTEVRVGLKKRKVMQRKICKNEH